MQMHTRGAFFDVGVSCTQPLSLFTPYLVQVLSWYVELHAGAGWWWTVVTRVVRIVTGTFPGMSYLLLWNYF
jgi:hypothetical protein